MKTLLLLAITISANAFSATNMILPILNCKLTAENQAQIVADGSNEAEGFTVLADYEDMMRNQDGKAMLVYSANKVGVDSKNELKTYVSIAEFGTYKGSNINSDEGLKNGVLFIGDLLTYNFKFMHVSVLTIDTNDSKHIKAELKQVAKGASDRDTIRNYDCKSGMDIID